MVGFLILCERWSSLKLRCWREYSGVSLSKKLSTLSCRRCTPALGIMSPLEEVRCLSVSVPHVPCAPAIAGVRDFSTHGQNAWATILDCSLTENLTYLAISRSQSQTWLSRKNTTAGWDLSLTSLTPTVGSDWASEIASAGSAGASSPARSDRRFPPVQNRRQPAGWIA